MRPSDGPRSTCDDAVVIHQQQPGEREVAEVVGTDL